MAGAVTSDLLDHSFNVLKRCIPPVFKQFQIEKANAESSEITLILARFNSSDTMGKQQVFATGPASIVVDYIKPDIEEAISKQF